MSADRIERRRRLLLAVLVALALGSAGLGVLAYEINLFGPYELSTIDTRFAISGTQRAPGIVIVGIDDQTLLNAGQSLGSPPYPRSDDARVINRLLADGAKAVAVDLQFSEPSNDPSQDQALVNAIIAAHGRAILASTAVGPNGTTPIFGNHVPSWGGRVGYTGLEQDSDGKIRTYPYAGIAGQPDSCCLVNFAIATLEQVTHRTYPRSDFPGGSAPIDFAGPPGTFPEIPYVDVSGSPANGYRATFKPATFRNKIVIVGATDTVLQDVHTVATGTLMSGPEIWANAIWSLEHGNPLRDAPGAVDLVLIVLLGLVIPLARLRLRLALAIDLAVALGLAYAGAAQLAFNAGTILSFTYPLFALLAGTVTSNAADALFERSQRLTLQAELARLPGASATFFVSYRREQSSWPAGILTSALTERFGEDSVFKDTESISAGEQWPQRIEDAINACDVMLVLIGPRWLDASGPTGRRRLDDPADWARREIETGLAASCAVVPVLLDGARMQDDEELPPSLRALAHRNAYALTPERWDMQLDELLASIQEGRIRTFLAAEAAGEGPVPDAGPVADLPAPRPPATPQADPTPPPPAAALPPATAPPVHTAQPPATTTPPAHTAQRPVTTTPPAHTAQRPVTTTPPAHTAQPPATTTPPAHTAHPPATTTPVAPVPPASVPPAPAVLAPPLPAAARRLPVGPAVSPPFPPPPPSAPVAAAGPPVAPLPEPAPLPSPAVAAQPPPSPPPSSPPSPSLRPGVLTRTPLGHRADPTTSTVRSRPVTPVAPAPHAAPPAPPPETSPLRSDVPVTAPAPLADPPPAPPVPPPPPHPRIPRRPR